MHTIDLPATTPNGAARAAALAAAGACDREPTGSITYQSAGRVLVIGTDTAIREVTAALAGHARLTVTGLVAGDGNATPQLSGHLGHFELLAGSAAPRVYDLVLDLGNPPRLPAEVPPPGYFAPGADPGALQAALAALPGLIGEFEKPKYFQYDASICAHGRSGITACTRCLDTCPTQAIRSLGECIEVDPHLCQGAGSCATACPTGAIVYAYPQRADTLQQLRALLQAWHTAGGSDAVILFHDGSDGQEALVTLAAQLPERVVPVAVEEIGSVGMDSWLAALAYGAAAVVLLATSRTPESVRRELDHQLKIAGELLAGMGYPDATLGMHMAGAAGLVGTLAALPGTDGRAPATFAALDEKRSVIRLAMEHLFAEAPAPRPLVSLPAGSPFGELQVDGSSCTLCMACVSQCPAHALEAGDERPQLVFIEANCVQCDLCCQTCPEDAITVAPRYLYDSLKRNQRRVLCEEEPFLCTHCGKPFATRQVIEKITGKMQHHPMFQGEALQRLKMCEDCRVKDLFAAEGMDDSQITPGGPS